MSFRVAVILLSVAPLAACSDPANLNPVSAWQRLTSAAGGADPLDGVRRADEASDNVLYHNRLIAESYRKCDDYRRSASVTQRGTSATLAWGAASAGALGLAFTPAGPATLAAFTAAGSILASASATIASSSYAGLTPETIEQRLRREYNAPMDELAKDIGAASLARIASIHSRCSLAYLLGEPS